MESNNILGLFKKLNKNSKIDIVGYINVECSSFKIIDLPCISEVITHIMNNKKFAFDIIEEKLKVPNISDKIKVNNLKFFGKYLSVANFHYKVIDDYFCNDPESKTILKNKIVSLYLEKSKNQENKDRVFV